MGSEFLQSARGGDDGVQVFMLKKVAKYQMLDHLKAALVYSKVYHSYWSSNWEAVCRFFSVGDEVIRRVVFERRKLNAQNHTCTHMKVLGNHFKGSLVPPEKLRFDFADEKPVKPDEAEENLAILNKQIEDELDVFSKEVKLKEAKRVKGLRVVPEEFYPDPVRVVAIENDTWLSLSTKLCGVTDISNTREAAAFALLSEKGVAKDISRVTAVTKACAFKAKELAYSLEQEVHEASTAQGSRQLEDKEISVMANIPTADKADLKAKILLLRHIGIKENKKIAHENIVKAVKVLSEMADLLVEKSSVFSNVSVGSDTAATREAVVGVI
ncbi:LOW QUALITY PROTEIN: hypothetical protein RJ639_026820 [Escallonia herrerae]|uniref:alanine--tRNA ligase n=1 Tax=Escallonia herrerae TaxID=1293975 RepID=A0AA88XK25_9ASTE|nr:LOW QUALITY PROTEIN: hypothetical protein RJ639_026820 [Escallonia herrerae]